MLATNKVSLNHQPLMTPEALIHKLPNNQKIIDFVHKARTSAADIIQGKDDRLLVVIGPCSIHDVHSAIEYAEKLKVASMRFCDDLNIIMRAYFQKPRTTLGWKGLIHDPFLNNTYHMNHGLCLARKLLITLNEMHIPAATEFVDPMIHHYLSDLISWSAIGARTVESQIHRELASGLAMPVGFKNNTDGNIKIAIDAVKVANEAHHYLGINMKGAPSIIETFGNHHCHIILRGSDHATNYAKEKVDEAVKTLKKVNLIPSLMIDCSHGNSMKEHNRQHDVLHDIAVQIRQGSTFIHGIMLESHLIAGKQYLDKHKNLVYGQSITDGCINWDDSLALLETLALSVRERNQNKCYLKNGND